MKMKYFNKHTVNGSVISEAHLQTLPSVNRYQLRVSVYAQRLNENNYGWNFAQIKCGHRTYEMGPYARQVCTGHVIETNYSTISVTTDEWKIYITGQSIRDPLSDSIRRRLDVSMKTFEKRSSGRDHWTLI